jgi:hypothetical protein
MDAPLALVVGAVGALVGAVSTVLARHFGPGLLDAFIPSVWQKRAAASFLGTIERFLVCCDPIDKEWRRADDVGGDDDRKRVRLALQTNYVVPLYRAHLQALLEFEPGAERFIKMPLGTTVTIRHVMNQVMWHMVLVLFDADKNVVSPSLFSRARGSQGDFPGQELLDIIRRNEGLFRRAPPIGKLS